MEESARAVDGVISGGPAVRIGGARYPAAPDCLIGTFDDSGILLRMRYWVAEPYQMQAIQSKVQTNVWDAFADTGIEIAYPHSHLVFDETSGELQIGTDDDHQTASGDQPTPLDHDSDDIERS